MQSKRREIILMQGAAGCPSWGHGVSSCAVRKMRGSVLDIAGMVDWWGVVGAGGRACCVWVPACLGWLAGEAVVVGWRMPARLEWRIWRNKIKG